jgi:hypothetical protein
MKICNRKYHHCYNISMTSFIVLFIYMIAQIQAIEVNNILQNPRKHTSAYRAMLLLKEKESSTEQRADMNVEDTHKFNSIQFKKAADVMNEVRFRNKNTVKHSVKHLLKHKMKIGGCACDFMSGVTATKIVGSTGNCAPKVALCGFCMNAAWAAYWHPDQDTCKQYVLGAKGVCESIAGGASAAAADIGFLYEKYGPQFGASAVWCREMGCCAMEAL